IVKSHIRFGERPLWGGNGFLDSKSGESTGSTRDGVWVESEIKNFKNQKSLVPPQLSWFLLVGLILAPTKAIRSLIRRHKQSTTTATMHLRKVDCQGAVANRRLFQSSSVSFAVAEWIRIPTWGHGVKWSEVDWQPAVSSVRWDRSPAQLALGVNHDGRHNLVVMHPAHQIRLDWHLSQTITCGFHGWPWARLDGVP